MVKTRIKAIVFCVVLLVVSAFSCVSAAAQDGDFIIENGILLSYEGADSEVTIPSEVIYIGDNAFRNNTSLEKVVLGDSVRGIGNCAFYGCTSLKYVEQTESVSAVGAYAFYDTSFLKGKRDEFFAINDILVKYNGSSSDVVIPSNIRSISPYTFAYDSSVVSAEIGSSVEEIGEGAFYMCGNLESVEIDPDVSVIGGYAFFDTPWLEEDSREFMVEGRGILIDCKSNSDNIVIPDDVATIGTGAFYMSGLKSVVFSQNTKVIGMRSFMGCKNLEEIEIPNGVLLIDAQAFYNCTALKSVYVAPSVEIIKTQSFVNDSGRLVLYGAYGSAAEQYASENGIPFNNTGSDSKLQGDVDGDGALTVADVTSIQKYVAGFPDKNFDSSVADINSDGYINVMDVTDMQKIIAGIM